MAYSRFWRWERSVWQDTVMPVGRWVRRTAEATFWTFWPPGPLERKVSILMSSGRRVMSDSLSTAGRISTLAKEVWRRLLGS